MEIEKNIKQKYGLTSKEVIQREEAFANWRLASNLTFNGLLINTLFSTVPGHSHFGFIQYAAPTLGILVSLSFLSVSILSMRVKNREILMNVAPAKEGKNWISCNYYTSQVLGPYVLTNIFLVAFWALYFFGKGWCETQ